MNGKPEPDPFAKFRALVKRVIAVPKPEIDKREVEYRKTRPEKRKAK